MGSKDLEIGDIVRPLLLENIQIKQVPKGEALKYVKKSKRFPDLYFTEVHRYTFEHQIPIEVIRKTSKGYFFGRVKYERDLLTRIQIVDTILMFHYSSIECLIERPDYPPASRQKFLDY